MCKSVRTLHVFFVQFHRSFGAGQKYRPLDGFENKSSNCTSTRARRGQQRTYTNIRLIRLGTKCSLASELGHYARAGHRTGYYAVHERRARLDSTSKSLEFTRAAKITLKNCIDPLHGTRSRLRQKRAEMRYQRESARRRKGTLRHESMSQRRSTFQSQHAATTTIHL